MIRAFLSLAIVLKLAAAHSISIPTITKEIGGTKIDIDVQVDIDTGGESDQAEGKVPPFDRHLYNHTTTTTTIQPEPKCLAEFQNCFDKRHHCCEGLVCSGVECVKKREREEIPPPTQPACVPEGQDCRRTQVQCCEGLKCGIWGFCLKPWIPPPPIKPEPNCIPKGQECMWGIGRCCEGLACDTSVRPRGKCRRLMTKPTVPTPPIAPPTRPTPKCTPAGEPCSGIGTQAECCEGLMCDRGSCFKPWILPPPPIKPSI